MRLVPTSGLFYLLSFLDRANIVSRDSGSDLKFITVNIFFAQGNAKILNSDENDDLQQVTHLSDQQYLVALMIFIVSYTIFEIPSNYMLKKFRPSRW